MRQLVLREGQSQDSGAGASLLSRVWTFIFCLTQGPVDPRILRTAFKRWAGGRQRGRPFKDGGATDFRREGRALALHREANQPPPVLLHMRSGPQKGG